MFVEEKLKSEQNSRQRNFNYNIADKYLLSRQNTDRWTRCIPSETASI